ncbi:MAG: trehalose-phosphatase [Candidatus Omnitrophica bacterium]|nr:trehalose-phosphatase [Candidatus Omnitrophota bacterium]
MVCPDEQPIDFFENIKIFEEQFCNKEIFIFLDYDGTLTPIVDTPDKAVMPSDTKKLVETLSGFYKVSIVSGRATDDVRQKVNIKDLFYAGSHGFEIVYPDGTVQVNEEAKKISRTINAAYEELYHRLRDVKGALVENVKYTISTHYRLVSDEDFPKVEQAVDETLQHHQNLRKTHGKRVFELRPDIDWDKGKAVEWILNVLNFDQEKHAAVYIGDDTTDEDAFKVLERRGAGIRVVDEPKESYARYSVKDTEAVKDVLKYFIDKKS